MRRAFLARQTPLLEAWGALAQPVKTITVAMAIHGLVSARAVAAAARMAKNTQATAGMAEAMALVAEAVQAAMSTAQQAVTALPEL